jgi:Putative stress-responsive transcriptional regulator
MKNTPSYYSVKTLIQKDVLIMERKLYLSDTNKKLGGVCGGIGEYFGIDPTIVRLLWFLSIFLSGAGILAYIVAWIVMPRQSYCGRNNW